MKKLRVILNKEPYVGMILEAAQAYHKETFGIILGKRVKKEKAFVYDTLVQLFAQVRNRSKYTSLEIRSESLDKTYSAIPKNLIKPLGDFHTHTRKSIDPSKEDIDDIKRQKTRYYLSFIMLVRPSESENTGFSYKNNELIYIRDIYSRKSKNKKTRIKTRLAAFYLDKIKGELKPIKAELEPSQWLIDLMNEDPLDKRKKQKPRKTLENIAKEINPKMIKEE